MEINKSFLERIAEPPPGGKALRIRAEAEMLAAARGIALGLTAGLSLYLLLALGVYFLATR